MASATRAGRSRSTAWPLPVATTWRAARSAASPAWSAVQRRRSQAGRPSVALITTVGTPGLGGAASARRMAASLAAMPRPSRYAASACGQSAEAR